jgi:hypothetical protein
MSHDLERRSFVACLARTTTTLRAPLGDLGRVAARGFRCATLALVLGGVLLTSCGAVRGPRYVDRITISNLYEYDVSVDVNDGRSGWLVLGTVRRQSETAVESVIDMGPVWVFRFRYRNRAEERLRVNRSILVESGWQIRVPQRLVERLRASGEPASYRPG